MCYCLTLNERKLSVVKQVKCLIETYTSQNGKKKKNNLLKQLHNLIVNR